MLRRSTSSHSCLFFAVAGLSGVLYAQLESGERGILPIDSSGTLEITGIHVDVGGKDAASARYAGWRIAQRQGFRALWAKTHKRPLSQAPNLADSTLDTLVSSIAVERDRSDPTAISLTSGSCSIARVRVNCLALAGGPPVGADAAYSGQVTGGTATSVELRNPGSAPGPSSGPRRARSIMSGSAALGSTRCW